MWDLILDVWHDVEDFFDMLVGWLYFVFGGAKDPYVYESFWDNKKFNG